MARLLGASRSRRGDRGRRMGIPAATRQAARVARVVDGNRPAGEGAAWCWRDHHHLRDRAARSGSAGPRRESAHDGRIDAHARRFLVCRRRARFPAWRDPTARGGSRLVKKWGEVALGIVTSIGGFLEVGSIATATQGGAEFGYQLAWVVVLGTLGLAMLMEMTGRLAAVSKRTYADLLRERFGFRFFVLPLVAVFVVSLLVLASEIGGASIALELASGIGYRWWALVRSEERRGGEECRSRGA